MHSHNLEPGKPLGSHSHRLHCLPVVCVSWARNTILAFLPKLFLLLTRVLKAHSWILLLSLELKFMDDPGREHLLSFSVCWSMCSGKDVFTPKFLVLRPFPSITSMNHITNASLVNLWGSYLGPWLKPSLSVIFFNGQLLRPLHNGILSFWINVPGFHPCVDVWDSTLQLPHLHPNVPSEWNLLILHCCLNSTSTKYYYFTELLGLWASKSCPQNLPSSW